MAMCTSRELESVVDLDRSSFTLGVLIRWPLTRRHVWYVRDQPESPKSGLSRVSSGWAIMPPRLRLARHACRQKDAIPNCLVSIKR